MNISEPPRTPEQEWHIEEARQRALKEPPRPPITDRQRERAVMAAVMAERLVTGCAGCGEPTPQKIPGQPRKWCSDACRRDATREQRRAGDRAYNDWNRRLCKLCGGECGNGSGKKRQDRPQERCFSCVASLHETRLSLAEGMYLDGWPIETMKAVLGYGPKSQPPIFTELRRLGRIGYRNRGWDRTTA